MKKRLTILLCASFITVSMNTHAVLGGKKGPPAAASQAWYQMVVNWF